jgi:hypothetical protein
MKNNYPHPWTHIEKFFRENDLTPKDRAIIRDIFGHLIRVAVLSQSEFERLPQHKRYSTAQAKVHAKEWTFATHAQRVKLARVFDVAYWQSQNPTAKGVMGGLDTTHKKIVE